MLLVFPNTFEYFFIVYALIALRWEPSHWSPRFWLWTATALWVCVKLPQEYWIHIAQRDFTETVADHPWFGVACALGLVVLAALFWFVARPRMPAPSTAANGRRPDPGRPPGAPPGLDRLRREDGAPRPALDDLRPHPPGRRTSAADVAVGVALIVAANTAISLRWSYMEFVALLLPTSG